jgi:peptide/nickel transport system substrate-binding protein
LPCRSNDRFRISSFTPDRNAQPNQKDTAMSEPKDHSYIPQLRSQLADKRLDRREFLRTATLLGVSAVAAYGMIGEAAPAFAQTALPKGGKLRIATRVFDVSDPHKAATLFASNTVRQTLEYLTKTGYDNITRPYLLESWKASDDLKTWTLNVRKEVNWRKGRQFTADDVIWNLKRVLDPATGSSVLGLMSSYLLQQTPSDKLDANGKPTTVTTLWDANAIERVDAHTVRLNLKQPQLAVPEHLFHFPLAMIDPEEGGLKPGGNGTGAFELTGIEVGRRATFKANPKYWGDGPYLDELEFIDLGDDSAAYIAALTSNQVDSIHQVGTEMLPILTRIPNVTIYDAETAQTALARVQPDKPPFDDKRIRDALKLAVDPAEVVRISLGQSGTVAENHAVSPVHPDYAPLPKKARDVAAAKDLLKQAGHPDGIDLEITCRKDPAWEVAIVQALVEQWKAAGIRVKINILPVTEYAKAWLTVPFGFTAWAHRPLGVMTYSLAYRSGVAWNESHFANPEFDTLLTQAEGTLDVEARKVIMAKLETILQEEGPIIQPAWVKIYTAYRSNVQGGRQHPSRYIFGNELAVAKA